MRWVFATLILALCGWSQGDALNRGQQAFLAGDLPAAESAFREHLASHPGDARALSNLAAVYSRREDYPEAVKLYQQAIQSAPGLVEIRFNLAIALLKSGNAAEATRELEAFLEARPNELRARQLLGISLFEAGDYRGAIAQLEQVHAAHPSEPALLFALAFAHIRGGDEATGRELLAGLQRYPAQSALLEGMLEYRAGRFDEARAKFEQCLRYESNQAPALAAIGRLNLLDKKDAEAIDYLQRALSLAPQDAESTYQLGVLYHRNGNTAKGRELLQRATRMRTNYADPYYQLARISHQDKQFQRALEEIDIANRLLPNHEAIRFLRGRILQSLGRREEARAEFEAVRGIKANTIEKARQRVEGELRLEP